MAGPAESLPTAHVGVNQANGHQAHGHEGPRRDFLIMALACTAAAGIAMAVWPFLDVMDPPRAVVTASDVSVNLGVIPVGTGITVLWKGQPILIRHRTPAEITTEANVDIDLLRDSASDLSRVKTGHADFIVLYGVCDRNGIVAVGNNPSDARGKWGGWTCPTNGSEYDTSGRVRSGPARKNLAIPPYDFSSATTITIG
jgi:ubiquinol-cytochrome c reductase iron-sulfur subunit